MSRTKYNKIPARLPGCGFSYPSVSLKNRTSLLLREAEGVWASDRGFYDPVIRLAHHLHVLPVWRCREGLRDGRVESDGALRARHRPLSISRRQSLAALPLAPYPYGATCACVSAGCYSDLRTRGLADGVARDLSDTAVISNTPDKLPHATLSLAAKKSRHTPSSVGASGRRGHDEKSVRGIQAA